MMAETPEKRFDHDNDRDDHRQWRRRRSSIASSSGSSGDDEVSVDLELGIEGEHGDAGDHAVECQPPPSIGGSFAGTSHSQAGLVDQNLFWLNILDVEKSTADSSNQLNKPMGRGEKLWIMARKVFDYKFPSRKKLTKLMGRGQKFWIMARKLIDDKASPNKKLKLLKQFASVKDDGTVQLEVPVDIKPKDLDFVNKVSCNGVSADESVDATDNQSPAPLQIVMLIVGTQGDVQPFVAIGKYLQEYGHRVRLATHLNFKEFVLAAGLEFFPLGGDPKVLAGYMVKNKGFFPSEASEIHIQRHQIKDIIFSLLPACTDPDPRTKVPFKVDAIIANPPAYGHTHVAEALKVPLHLFFTMPWTPTSKFPHPLSRVKHQVGYRISYYIVDTLIWLGIRDIINEFRKKKLNLRPVTYLSRSNVIPLDVPYGYIWSPRLVPKPEDWGRNIDVVGFCFLDLASNYVPPDSLVKWIKGGRKPIYIGFGSLPILEPDKMTQTIAKALEITGRRGIISKGWGGLGNLAEPKDFIYLVDNCPHDWLFFQCAAVCPTTVVPFFGDQPFWGEQVRAKGIGPPPIPIQELSLDKLINAINFMEDPKVKKAAEELAEALKDEDGVTGAVKAFHKHFIRQKYNRGPNRAGFRHLCQSRPFSGSRCSGCF
ncbi:sterol 3-beta-glucosyltransferase UGT80A2-like isoform X5 [Diospyros lotus]|uniref:sterol 3-beta-glucosyltransferase UGT80A2-like isoform X5 n=1 Tax=Diospyros lotus TaxID=55363 RepID=UPI002258058B|nr:sterol 3-beta-glucosyltransferase UGT80A2-like isoform X5 [Diospyros lotus]